MFGAGVIEGFFGPEWSWESRHHFCETIQASGGGFYIYAPKRDPFLRKNWQQNHPAEMWAELQKLSKKCHSENIKFGLGLSPFEIHAHWNTQSKQILKDKILKLEDLDLDYFGLFFDDMCGSADLADKQAEIVEFTRSVTKKTLLFCPTYYSNDPILDKVFGTRAPDYLEKIGKNIATDVQIFWTGSKVIPSIITDNELIEVAGILRRKPFIWENFFANDGPKQCKFLKLKSFQGRSHATFEGSCGWALNLMNQASLSEILFHSSAQVLNKSVAPDEVFIAACRSLAGEGFASFVKKYAQVFSELGLDKMDSNLLTQIRSDLDMNNRFFNEIAQWLDGKYLVGPECLTD